MPLDPKAMNNEGFKHLLKMWIFSPLNIKVLGSHGRPRPQPPPRRAGKVPVRRRAQSRRRSPATFGGPKDKDGFHHIDTEKDTGNVYPPEV